jgi:glycosyltransferase involved in cell wall biosynthesis
MQHRLSSNPGAPEKGLNKNFYSAMAHANGEYVSFSDQDDVWDPKKIEKLVSFHEANKDASMVYCLSRPFEGEIKEPLAKIRHGIKRLEGIEIRNTMLVSFTLGHNLLIKRSLLTQLPVPANEVIAYDWWITVSAMCKGPIKCLHEELTYWRQHPDNTTKVLNEDLFHISRAEYLKAFATNPLIGKKDKEWIQELRSAFLTLTDKRFSPGLFRLLLANAPLLFFYKRKNNPVGKWISYAKWAYRMSKHDYRP